MTRRRISSGSTFEEQIGYSRAIVDGDWIFVSGTTGYDYATMTIAAGVVEQAEQCCCNIAAALEQAGSSMADVVRVHYILPDAADFTRMSDQDELYVQAVLHKAFVDVNEEGTEAAAATGVVVIIRSAPLEPETFRADRPFVFLIRDKSTGGILFLGRVVDPIESE